mmetsp:Transcript_21129/g.24511  ORF Transcript_21129/g.24511 Transcript_21129/m.24511 type:complete len:280 (+) Transcript_21129:1715-2554(+)
MPRTLTSPLTHLLYKLRNPLVKLLPNRSFPRNSLLYLQTMTPMLARHPQLCHSNPHHHRNLQAHRHCPLKVMRRTRFQSQLRRAPPQANHLLLHQNKRAIKTVNQTTPRLLRSRNPRQSLHLQRRGQPCLRTPTQMTMGMRCNARQVQNQWRLQSEQHQLQPPGVVLTTQTATLASNQPPKQNPHRKPHQQRNRCSQTPPTTNQVCQGQLPAQQSAPSRRPPQHHPRDRPPRKSRCSTTPMTNDPTHPLQDNITTLHLSKPMRSTRRTNHALKKKKKEQ